jgi:hypothetical protein
MPTPPLRTITAGRAHGVGPYRGRGSRRASCLFSTTASTWSRHCFVGKGLNVRLMTLARLLLVIVALVSIRKVTGFHFGLSLLRPHIVQLCFVKHDLDRIIPA